MELTFLDTYGYLRVVTNKIEKLTVKVFDSNGRIAKKVCKDIIEGVQQLDLNIGELSNGTYILNTFSGDTFLKAFKFIKQ